MREARYPKFSDKERYILVKAYQYYQEINTEQLSFEQLKHAVQQVTYNIAGLVEHSRYTSEAAIKLMRIFLEPAYRGDKVPRATNEEFLFKCIKRDVSFLSRWFQKWLPESADASEEYFNFITKMTKEVITEICAETEKYITEEKARFSAQSAGEAGPDPVSFTRNLEHERPPQLLEGEPSAKRVKINEEKNTTRTI